MKKVLLLVAVCATTTVFSLSAQDVKKEKKDEAKKEQVEEKKEEVKDNAKEEKKEETVIEATKVEEAVTKQ